MKKKKKNKKDETESGNNSSSKRGEGESITTSFSTNNNSATMTDGVPTSTVTSRSLNQEKFNVLTSASYWLSRVRESEAAANHKVSLGFFKLALEAECEDVKLLRDELMSYDRRHNLLDLGESATEVFQSYNILKQQDTEEDQTQSIYTVLDCIIPFIRDPDDRKSFSLICRKGYELESMTRKHVTLHLHYATTASRLIRRFPSIESITLKGFPRGFSWKASISISQSVAEISTRCSFLKVIKLHSVVVTDSDLELLARTHGKRLRAFKLKFCSGYSTDGLLHIGKHCNFLRSFYIRDDSYSDHKNGEWFHQLALHNSVIERLDVYLAYWHMVDYKDLVLLATNCSQSLVCLKLGGMEQVNISEEEYSSFKLPPNVRCISFGCIKLIVCPAVLSLAPQLTELDFREAGIDTTELCQLVERCPNLQVLYTSNHFNDTGLQRIGQLCKKLRKLHIDSYFDSDPLPSHLGLIALAQGCLELEYIHIYLNSISNEAIRCVGVYLKNLRDFHLTLDDDEYEDEDEDEYENENEDADEEKVASEPIDNGVRDLLIGCSKLERLGICVNQGLTDVGLAYIGKYGHSLRYLSLSIWRGWRGSYSDEGLVEISKGCPKLLKLKLPDRAFSSQALVTAFLNMNSLRYIWEVGPRFGSPSDCRHLALTRPKVLPSTVTLRD